MGQFVSGTADGPAQFVLRTTSGTGSGLVPYLVPGPVLRSVPVMGLGTDTGLNYQCTPRYWTGSGWGPVI